jgi:predicted CopG family antitoxin
MGQTTIRVDEETADTLKQLKEQRHASSYNEVVQTLIEHEQERISMFGDDPELAGWDEDDRARLGENRP